MSEQTVKGPDGWQPNILLDDGGDLTQLMHEKYGDILDDCKGVSEETTTGVLRLYGHGEGRNAESPGHQRQ